MMHDHDGPRRPKLTLNRESLRELSPQALRAAAGGVVRTQDCPYSDAVYCTVTVLNGQSCTCIHN